MWPFTRKGGLSKFHAMAIFTVLAVKWRKIIGMWVKFLQHTVNTPWKKSRPPWNISRREKGHSHLSPWNIHFTPGKRSSQSLRNISRREMLNVVVLLNHAYLRGRISVICFKHWNLKVIIIQNRYNRFRRSGVDGYTGVCYCVSLLKNTQLQFVSFVFIEQIFIDENATECSQVLFLHDERDIYF